MIYTIKEGNHYASGIDYRIFKLLNTKKTKAYNVVFNETALYAFNDADKEDINKLFGFTIGLPSLNLDGIVHNNSARFGWDCVDGVIHIHAYCYVNKVRITERMLSINLNENYTYILTNNAYEYSFAVSNATGILKQVSIPKPNISGLSFNLWPYFGGDKTAPHDIHISMIEI